MAFPSLDELLKYATPTERAQLARLADERRLVWHPQIGPQEMLLASTADVVGFGGSAGGGKTEGAIGKALRQHNRIQIFRRHGPELLGIRDRITELVGPNYYNGRDNVFRIPRLKRAPCVIELCSAPNAGDEVKFQGRPKDLLVFEEAANFLEQQVRFVSAWLRDATGSGIKPQMLLTFNPPTSAEGRWLVEYFAPWVDPKWPGVRAMPGEVRYVARVNNKDVWVDDPRPFIPNQWLPERKDLWDYRINFGDKMPEDRITPQSRTFIPAKVTDNAYLRDTGYIGVLQSLPEPLRSQMLYGDFSAGIKDAAMQVIPTAWVDAAVARWTPREGEPPEMSCIGVDVSRGGRDETVIARRHGAWFDVPVALPGEQAATAHPVAALVMTLRRSQAPIAVDVIGPGAAVVDLLSQSIPQDVHGINVSERAGGTDFSGQLRFLNQRSEQWWRMRDLLDPDRGHNIALPDHPLLIADLTAPHYSVNSGKIAVEDRDAIMKKIGRSPDYASAYLLAALDIQRYQVAGGAERAAEARRKYSPFG